MKFSKRELEVIERLNKMIDELELNIKMKEAKQQVNLQKNSSSGADQVMMGGQMINEEEFMNEDLCQICCFQAQNTEFVPCGHMTCKKCIQTHMLNSQKCPFCNVEITSLKTINK